MQVAEAAIGTWEEMPYIMMATKAITLYDMDKDKCYLFGSSHVDFFSSIGGVKESGELGRYKVRARPLDLLDTLEGHGWNVVGTAVYAQEFIWTLKK